MGCGRFLVKYVLFFVNLFFALSGLALLGVGIAVQLQLKEVLDVLDEQEIVLAPIGTIVAGAVVFVIAFFGCCGSIRESNCMLVTYAVIMIILMVAKVALASLIFVNISTVVSKVPSIVNTAFQNDRPHFTVLESALHCCGTIGAESYGNEALPASCCETAPCSTSNAYGGCTPTIEDFLTTFGNVIGIMVIIVAAFELIAVIFALCLANHARNAERRGRY